MASRARQIDRSTSPIRVANASDVPALTSMLVRAYIDDPLAVWACRPARARAKLLEALYSARLRDVLTDGEVWTDPDLTSVAVWLPPQAHKPSVGVNLPLLRCVIDPRVVTRAPLWALGLRAMRRAHPRQQRCWYLWLLGTDPGARRRGLGTAVLQPVLERCDGEQVGAYLETANPDNLGFYARCNFQVTAELRLPRGPAIWPMWREPHSATHP